MKKLLSFGQWEWQCEYTMVFSNTKFSEHLLCALFTIQVVGIENKSTSVPLCSIHSSGENRNAIIFYSHVDF